MLRQRSSAIVPDHEPVFACAGHVPRAYAPALHKARAAGRSSAYEAEERNAASRLILPQFIWDGALRAVCCVRFAAKGINHSRPRLSCIPSRKAAVAPAWDLFRGSLSGR